jgi:hypothetical protein
MLAALREDLERIQFGRSSAPGPLQSGGHLNKIGELRVGMQSP